MTPLAAMLGSRTDSEFVRKRGWLDQGILVVSENDYRLTWDQREMLRQIGRKLYGQRLVAAE